MDRSDYIPQNAGQQSATICGYIFLP